MTKGIECKVSVNLRNVRQLFPVIVAGFQKLAGEAAIIAVKKELSIGKSPVDGVGRLRGYSETYQHEIKTYYGKKYGKKNRPVNLYLTGKMVGSMYSETAKDGITLGVDDKKAVYHDKTGAGKSRVIRRILPTRKGEMFSRTIMQKINKLLSTEVIKSAISRLNLK